MAKSAQGQIALNKKARHDYFIEETIQAGISLQGWEVKAIRAGKMRITESYVVFRDGEAYLFGAHIQPLIQSSTHVNADPLRTRKLLMSRREIDRLIGLVNQKGHTVLALSVYWKGPLVKVDIALARGKKLHDKRQTLKERDWERQKQRGFKQALN